MAKAIWKYPIVLGEFEVRMPEGCELLTVQVQGVTAQLWALVDPEAPLETRQFVVAGTGQLLPDWLGASDYVGTYQAHGGALIWHLFRRPTESEGPEDD